MTSRLAPSPPEVRVLGDGAWADAVAAGIEARIDGAIAGRGEAHLVLSGGGTPEEAYARLAERAAADRRSARRWRSVDVWWGDERCVAPGHPDSNYGAARRSLLDRLPVPPRRVHRIEGERPPEEAARRYRDLLRQLAERQGAPGEPPVVDVLLLGLGADGHLASLFPGDPALEETTLWAVASAPRRSASGAARARVTLTFPVLLAARSALVLARGAGKADAVASSIWRPGPSADRPARRLLERTGATVWFLDDAAAANRPAG